jgi:acetolactate synthase I/II/III large subunit
MMMKAADYVADFLVQQGIKHVFAIAGGASVHLIHAISERDDIDCICPHHEQGGAIAAEAYSRATGNIGCAMATSGPGATNMITGIASAWFDSIPVLYITGQVTRFRLRGDLGVRQIGFQETDIVSMAHGITKYANMVTDPADLRYELEYAAYVARSGRPGPVLIDIPDDLQREMVDPDAMRPFTEDSQNLNAPADDMPSIDFMTIVDMVQAAERPVLILGNGIHLSGGLNEAHTLIDGLGIPVCPTWAAADMVSADNPYLSGTFGTHGTRAGNFTVQNADLVLSIGARLSLKETGSPLNTWARDARTIVVDIDQAELDKFEHFGKPLDLAICSDAKSFLGGLIDSLKNYQPKDIDAWLSVVKQWKAKYAACQPTYYQDELTNPYVFVDKLSAHLEPDEIIVVDTGCAIAWMMQAFKFKKNQRVFHAFNNTPMGYALPASIGSAFASGGAKRIICIAGDGSLMMNLQELATINHHQLDIKLFLLNNGGYSMIRQTQEQWLDSKYYASSAQGGLSFPDFSKLSTSFGLAYKSIRKNQDIDTVIEEVLAEDNAVMCDVVVPSDARVLPQCKFGYPIEDAEPLLPRDEFMENMLVEPLPISKEEI